MSEKIDLDHFMRATLPKIKKFYEGRYYPLYTTLIVALEQSVRERNEIINPCVWEEDCDGNWETSCDQTFCLDHGCPSENGMKYCCYCGKPLVEKRYAEEDGSKEE